MIGGLGNLTKSHLLFSANLQMTLDSDIYQRFRRHLKARITI